VRSRLCELYYPAVCTSDLDPRLLPKFKSFPWDEEWWKSLVLSLHLHRAKIPSGADPSTSIKNIIKNCVALIIDRAHITFTASVTDRWGLHGGSSAVDKSLIRLLDLCHKTGNPRLYTRALDRVLAQEQLQKHRNEFRSVLSPLLSALLTFLKSIGSSPKESPFSTAITIIISTYVDHVVGPKPDEKGVKAQIQQYSRIGCGCIDCRNAITFLTSSPKSQGIWARLGATKSRHVAGKLAGLPSVKADVITTCSPYSLSVGSL